MSRAGISPTLIARRHLIWLVAGVLLAAISLVAESWALMDSPQTARSLIATTDFESRPFMLRVEMPGFLRSGDYGILKLDVRPPAEQATTQIMILRARLDVETTSVLPQGDVFETVAVGQDAQFRWRIGPAVSQVVHGTVWIWRDAAIAQDKPSLPVAVAAIPITIPVLSIGWWDAPAVRVIAGIGILMAFVCMMASSNAITFVVRRCLNGVYRQIRTKITSN